MKPFRRLIRLGGVALIVAAVIQAVATFFDPDLIANINAIESPSWVWSHVAFAVAYTLALPGVVALYLRHADRLGWLGETGFVLTLFGSALTVSVSLLVGAALPLIATPGLTRSCAFFEPARPLYFMRPRVAFTALTYFPGFVLTGVAAVRAAVISPWPAWFLVLGALGTLGALVGPGAVARAITIGGSLLLGVAFAWIGWELAGVDLNT